MKQRSVSVIITNSEDKFLLQLRKQEDMKALGGWNILGGKIEEGESPKEAVIRKTMEEAGIILKDIEFLDKFDYGDLEEHIFCARFDGKVDKSCLKEGEDMRFFDRNEIKNTKLALNVNETLEKFFRRQER